MSKKYRNLSRLETAIATMKDYIGQDLDRDTVSSIERSLLHATNATKNKKPRTKHNYIGVEIECYSKKNRVQVFKALHELNLLKNVTIGYDSSIYPPSGSRGYEFKVLATEKSINEVLSSVGKFLKKVDAKTNQNCGLHVHFDMRNRKVDRCFKNLEKSQVLLFNLVNKSRINNDYCEFTEEGHNERSRSAINRGAYGRHKTIEVRLHHGTTDVDRIGKWIDLLLAIVKTRRHVDEIKTMKDLDKNNVKLPRGTKAYIKKYYKKHFKKPKPYWERNGYSTRRSFENRFSRW